ncbi:MAG: helix-turn-helix transcriptional regulator [Oscillospiraceae bacterium]|nr:helix-turn-helix transcriptional regulator [Oscillospiraceae bacterium]
MDFQKAVAQNIREIRERKKITLDAAAKLTGVSRSMLAQIEKGDVNPTISVLWKIANGYKVSFTSLVDTDGRSHLLIRADEVTPLAEDEGRYINRPAFPFQEDTHFETYRIEIKPEGFLQAQPHMGGTEEFLTVFSGEVEITAGAERFRIAAGDSLRFKADVAHSYRNVGSETAHLHMLIHYSDK